MKIANCKLIGLVLAALMMARVSLGATVNLAWDASPDAAVATNNITYTVWTVAPGNVTSSFSAGAATTASVGGLANNTAYTFHVTAVNGSGVHSLPSNEVGYSIPDSPINAPVSYFQSIARQPDGSYRATMSWNASPTNYAITNYLMIARLSDAASVTWLTNQVGTNLTGSMLMPSFEMVTLYMQGQSAIAFSPLRVAVQYVRPGQSKNLRILSVSQQ
jgi:hypothetical protein